MTRLLALGAGDDLATSEAAGVRAHVAECESCRSEYGKFLQVISVARTSGAGMAAADNRLGDDVRRRIAAEAARTATARSWTRWMPHPAFLPRPALALAAAGLVAVLSLPFVGRDARRPVALAEDSPRIQVMAKDGVVRLAWTDGQKASYTVLKSSNPRDFSRGEAHVVRGNVWTDTHPSTSPVVFYSIE